MTPSTIAIIGAGPAGSAAAFHLARGGLDVTLIESRAFPRVKVCGEFVSPAATGLLESIVPPERLVSGGARRVDRFVLRLGRREHVLTMPTPAWALSRWSLDELLLDAARAAGTRVVQPAPVTGVDYAQDHATVHMADGASLEAQIVLHADGHGRFCPSPPTPSAPGLVGHKCHFIPDEPITGVTIRAAKHAYVGTIQVETHDHAPGPHATVALVARKTLLASHKGDIDAMVRSLWPAWEPARRTTPWLSCGVARSGFQDSGHPRAFRVGNAAGAVDPVGGEGIGLALWAGTTLAGLLRAGTPTPEHGPDRPGVGLSAAFLLQVQRRYARLYRRRLSLRRPSCHVAAECLMRPRLIGAIWPLLGLRRLTLAPWYAATGKPLGIRPRVTPTAR